MINSCELTVLLNLELLNDILSIGWSFFHNARKVNADVMSE